MVAVSEPFICVPAREKVTCLLRPVEDTGLKSTCEGSPGIQTGLTALGWIWFVFLALKMAES